MNSKNKNPLQKLTISNGTYTFELVERVPAGYRIWNIGKEAPYGCIPLCRVIPNTNNVDLDTLKAIRVEGAYKVMMALGNGCNTIAKMERFVQRHKYSPEDSWEYRKILKIQEALPILKSLHWD